MDNKEFSKNLEIRTNKFAISIIKLSCKLPDTPEAKVIRTQLTKSGTSVGANYREANRSRSKPDFANKIKICESEASETAYWLEIIEEIGWLKNGVTELITESNELLEIFTSTGHTLKLR
jgi:four helix bundle protein